MALRQRPDPTDIPTGVPGLSDAQLGTVAEDRLATAIELSAAGSVAVAFPLLDLGFDLYPRPIRTLRAHPVQVKARSFLELGRGVPGQRRIAPSRSERLRPPPVRPAARLAAPTAPLGHPDTGIPEARRAAWRWLPIFWLSRRTLSTTSESASG